MLCTSNNNSSLGEEGLWFGFNVFALLCSPVAPPDLRWHYWALFYLNGGRKWKLLHYNTLITPYYFFVLISLFFCKHHKQWCNLPCMDSSVSNHVVLVNTLILESKGNNNWYPSMAKLKEHLCFSCHGRWCPT